MMFANMVGVAVDVVVGNVLGAVLTASDVSTVLDASTVLDVIIALDATIVLEDSKYLTNKIDTFRKRNCPCVFMQGFSK